MLEQSHVAERKAPKSPYTTDRQIPGAFEGETVTRRRFMTTSAHTGGAVEEKDQPWQAVGRISEFSDEDYVPRTVTIQPDVADAGLSTVYVRRFNPAVDQEQRDEYNEYIAISTACMHLGCPVQYVTASQRFICPCHGGVYDFAGKVVGGPPVRPLDRFYTRVAKGVVFIGPRFSVNSELQRFSPRDPGAPLDGVGQYLYPSRPTMRKLPGT
jgi:Rieske Fe-S protein